MGNKHPKKINKKEKNIIENNIKKEIREYRIKDKYKYNILFIGESNTGTKTSLIRRITEDKFIDKSEVHKKIINKLIYEKDDKEIILYLIDINGKKEMRYLCKQYYENADCIILGYDATNKKSFEEVQDYWSQQIKQINKNILVYLLGNKIDLKSEIVIKEIKGKQFALFYHYKYFSISVKENINIQDFITDLKSNIENNVNNNINNGIKEIIFGSPSKQSYKTVLLGDSGVGSKTSLVNSLVNNHYDPGVMSTTGASYSFKSVQLKNGKELKVEFWDTAGQERYKGLTKFFYKDCDCIILGYDVTRNESFNNIKTYWFPTSKENSNANLIYLLGNKIDLIENRTVDENEARNYAEQNNIRYFEISCKTYIGLNEFFDDLVNELIKI